MKMENKKLSRVIVYLKFPFFLISSEFKSNDYITTILTYSNKKHRFFLKTLTSKNSKNVLHILKLSLICSMYQGEN